MAEANKFHASLGLLSLLDLVGDLTMLAGRIFARLDPRHIEWGELVMQIRLLGIKSLTISNLTAVFAGMVMTLQFGASMTRFGAREYVGQVVSVAIVRELGPVLTALMVGGRIGAGMTAELGSMRVTEQIDAIRVLGADPLSKLMVPRIWASTLIVPLLSIISDVVGVLGGMLVAKLEFGISPTYYYQSVIEIVGLNDFVSGIAKAAVFGFFIGLIACRQGFETKGGTEGVGAATTGTVVITSITTLLLDLLLTKSFMVIF